MDAFFPMKLTVGGRDVSIAKMTTWTNLKAMLANAGTGGSMYPNFVPFLIIEIRQHLGLYIFNGLNPSPQVEMKFEQQEDDEVNGNDFIYESFGSNAEQRHRHFKAFFAVQDPILPTPDCWKHPLHKVQPLINWMNKVNCQAWTLGETFSINEMTIRFQGHHPR
jgi:hypothetical protein